jgi:hypothetical protein
VEKMNMNRIEMSIKKNVNGALHTLFGVITNSKVERSKLHNYAGQVENINFEREVERIFLEVEVLKAQAYEYAQEFQKR